MPFRGVDMNRLADAHREPGKKKIPFLHIPLKTLAADGVLPIRE